MAVPSDYSDLALWLNAEDLDGALNDGDPVSTWEDASASGLDATGAGGSRPTFKTNIVNGLPVVRFDGSDDTLANAAPHAATSTDGWTVFVVLSGDTNTGTQVAVANGSQSGTNSGYVLRNVTGTRTASLYSTAVTSQGFGTYTAGVWEVWSAVKSASASGVVAMLNGAVKGFGAGGYTTAAGTLVIGGGTFDGDIAEIVAYSRPLTSAEFAGIHTYLATRYGITEATARTGFGDQAPANAPQDSNGADISVAVAFRATTAGKYLTKARLWIGANTQGSLTGATPPWNLYKQNPAAGGGPPGAAVASGTFGGLTHDAWNESTLETPYSLESGTDYYLTVYFAGGHYYLDSVDGRFAGEWELPGDLMLRKDHGDSSAANVDDFIRQGGYHSGTGIAPIDSSYNQRWFGGVDVEIAAAGGVDVNVPAASATADTPSPTVIAASVITAVTGVATADLPAPTVTGASTITAVAAVATATAPAPAFTAASTIAASPAAATATAPAPLVTAGAGPAPRQIISVAQVIRPFGLAIG